MIDMRTSCGAAPKGSEKTSSACISPITFTSPLINTPSESNLQSSPVKPTHHLAHRANQAVEMTRYYFKILVEKVQELGATFRASSGFRPQENQQGVFTSVQGLTQVMFPSGSLLILMIRIQFSSRQQIQ